MPANQKTNDYLKECMADALISLMKTKPFEKITIDEIASASEVHRTTWFRNFSSKSEMLTFKLMRMWDKWGETHHVIVKKGFAMENAQAFYEFNYEIRDFLKLIMEANQSSALYEAFYKTIMEKKEATAAESYRARFYSYGLLGILMEWINRNFNEDPQKMIAMLSELQTA
ncbi:MAG: TetR/AcrR family transcriptional regulator [Sphaerochaetaceae bacterium]|nr:TetR/AcrR family transcriptional regulator [Sphaerochaetaceae bacterium]